MQKGTKEWFEAKKKAREALDQLAYAGDPTAYPVKDGTVGHEEGPEGTWNTSGVELPRQTVHVRDVRPETSSAVSVEGLSELGVPVRDESDYRAGAPAPFVPVSEPLGKEDRTLDIQAAAEANPEAAEKQSGKGKGKGKAAKPDKAEDKKTEDKK